MCFTYGQWLQMNATTAGLPASVWEETVLPVTASGSENAGSVEPRASIREGVATMAFPIWRAKPLRTRGSRLPIAANRGFSGCAWVDGPGTLAFRWHEAC